MKSVEEFYVKTLEFAGFRGALKALRLPFGKDLRSGTVFFSREDAEDKSLRYSTDIAWSDKDMELMHTLIKRGDEHGKVMRGIMVWCHVNAPRYFHAELDTYRVGAERLGSESTMHIQGQGLPTDELVKMKEELPEGTMQQRVWMFSYQTLRRIYFQRRNHRLPQWHTFCEWIESLPYAKELITFEE